MYSVIVGSIFLSIVHAAIPNHWLPIIVIGKKEQWTVSEVVKVAIIVSLAHSVSTVIIGMLLGFLAKGIAETVTIFTHYITPTIFIVLGLVFIFRHHFHKHIDLQEIATKSQSKGRIVIALVTAMFFSPCMEINAYFLLAGTQSNWLVPFIAFLYFSITTICITLLVWFAYKGLLKMNWQALELYAGIVTGLTLIITGVISFYIF